MPFSKLHLIKLCMFLLPFYTIFAIPIDEINNGLRIRHDKIESAKLLKRVPGDSASNPIDASFNITRWPNIAEEDCFAMLCLRNGNRVYQRNPTRGAGRTQYRASGASLTPFQADELVSRHTDQINSETISAEEFPWKSTQEGGANANVFPATGTEQTMQGVAISAGYRNANVPYSKFFRITFQPATLFGTYCTALFKNPPDFSVCQKKNVAETLFGVPKVVVADYAYKVVKGKDPIYFIHAAGSHIGTKRSEDVVLQTVSVEADG